MKRRIKKEDLVVFLQELDTRIQDRGDAWIDRVITNGFAQLSTVTQQFSTETSVTLDEYYETGETRFTINLKQDVTAIYDMYVLKQHDTESQYLHGEQKNRNANGIYQDPQNNSAVNVDLDAIGSSTYDSAVVKYHYTPNADFDDIYVAGDVYLALEYALAAMAYDMLHDKDKSVEKLASMMRVSESIADEYPDDFGLPGKRNMFPGGI